MDEFEPLPPVSERLHGLKPSHELLEFYRQKIDECDGEHAEMLARLERYKATFAEQVSVHEGAHRQHKLAWQLAQREEEVSELQKALSDMQGLLYQERDHGFTSLFYSNTIHTPSLPPSHPLSTFHPSTRYANA